MSTIQDLFQQAQLAEAAYANFINPNTGAIYNTDAGIQAALIASGFSSDPDNPTQSTQAAAFVAQWEVVNQYSVSGMFGLTDGSGFSGTVFRSKATGEYSFALRGTAGATDLLADAGDVLADGIALDQVVDMYNYWQSLTHTGTYQAAQLNTLTAETLALRAAYHLSPAAGLAYEATLRLNNGIIIDNPSHAVRTIQFVDSPLLSDARLQNGSGILAGTVGVNVDGHSLGGHLAMAFSRLFPNATVNVVAVNGAGFNSANTNVDTMFFLLGGNPGFDAGKITNVVGSAAMNMVSQDWLFLQQPVGRNEIYTESYLPGTGTTLGHGSGQMTDSLAIYNLLSTLDPSLNTDPNGLTKIAGLLKAASNVAENSLETVAGALSQLFLNTVPQLRTDNREDLYQAVSGLRTYLADKQGSYTLDPLTSKTRDDLIALAQSDVAYRYALKELNPFAVVGADYSATRNAANAALDLYDNATGLGLTANWLEDRAAMLTWAIKRNTEDSTATVMDGPEQLFRDLTTRTEIRLGSGSDADRRHFIFGSDRGEILLGGNQLYGARQPANEVFYREVA